MVPKAFTSGCNRPTIAVRSFASNSLLLSGVWTVQAKETTVVNRELKYLLETIVSDRSEG